MAKQALRDRFDHDQVVRREHRARVINRLRFGGDAERPHAQVRGDLLAGLECTRHAFDGGPRPLEPCRRLLRLDDGLQRMERAERRSCGDQGPERFLPLRS